MSYDERVSEGSSLGHLAAVPPVIYFEHELMPGKKMFRCVRLSSTLQVTSCEGMWREANAGKQEPGAMHAGVQDASVNPFRGKSMCARCNRSDLRLIGGNICVGCKNREYEWIKGANAKGRPPTKHPPLDKRVVRFVVDGEVRTMSRVHSASMEELVVELLRDSPKRVMLGRGKGRVMLRQGELV
jgi:hypothetical protein